MDAECSKLVTAWPKVGGHCSNRIQFYYLGRNRSDEQRLMIIPAIGGEKIIENLVISNQALILASKRLDTVSNLHNDSFTCTAYMELQYTNLMQTR